MPARIGATESKTLKMSSVMILGVGGRVQRDAEIIGRMKILDDETVERDASGKRKTRDIVDYIGEDCSRVRSLRVKPRQWRWWWLKWLSVGLGF